MDDLHQEQPPWLPELMDRVRLHLAALEQAEPDRSAALHEELVQLDVRIKGGRCRLPIRTWPGAAYCHRAAVAGGLGPPAADPAADSPPGSDPIAG